MSEIMHLTYASSITDLCENNASFDSGVLRICYSGKNRNGSSISKAALKKAIKSIYNCPVVCNYIRESDTLGGHDIDAVKTADGGVDIINITYPVGVIPESSKVWFENVEEDDGTVNEYLYAEALIWKRQEAYSKIKADGIVSHSMEISVSDGAIHDGIYFINDFEFTAFTLIGVEPCFESSSLTMFEKQDFESQFSSMMKDLKTTITQITSSNEADDKKTKKYSTKGGNVEMKKNEIKKLADKYEINIEELDFELDNLTKQELIAKFEEIKASDNKDPEDETKEDSDDVDVEDEDKFELNSNLSDDLRKAVSEETIYTEWGEAQRFMLMDFDAEIKEVYCVERPDWILVGMAYSTDGDKIVIDFESKKRKKVCIVDFKDGDSEQNLLAPVFSLLDDSLEKSTTMAKEVQEKDRQIEDLTQKVNSFNTLKDQIRERDVEAIISKFSDLEGISEFDELKANNDNFSLEELEEKCYAIKGKNAEKFSFSTESKKAVIKVAHNDLEDEPYGDLFTKHSKK